VEAVAELNKAAARGLKSNIANFPTARGTSLADAVASARRSSRTRTRSAEVAHNLGIEDEERRVEWCKVPSEAAAFGRARRQGHRSITMA
jgi:hypothetical protein